MIEKDTCYFCTSAFQLFAIFSLALSRDEVADLYIDPQFANAEAFAQRIERTSIFDKVKLIDSKSIYEKYMSAGPGLRNHFQIASSYFYVGEIAKMILIPDACYNNIFLSSKAYLPRMVQLSYVKKKRHHNVFYFDDGVGTYYKDRAYRINKLDEWVRFLLFGRKATETNYKRYVFSKRLFDQLNPDIISEELSRFWEECKGKDLVNDIFKIQEQIEIQERLIVLDQPKEELFDYTGAKEITQIYKKMVNKVGYDNTIIKLHPRSREPVCEGIAAFKNTGIPFELYCLNVDMSDKIIVSHSSTAVTTPKVLFDQEPRVIVLTKLVNPKTGEKNLFEDYFQAVKQSYRDPDKFLIPESIEELEQIVEKL